MSSPQITWDDEEVKKTPKIEWDEPKPMSPSERKKGGGTGIPGSFEGHTENIGEYIPQSFGEIGGGFRDILHGDFAKGGHRILAGTGAALLPVAALTAPAIASAPASTGVTLGTSYAGGKLAKSGAESFGANPEQAQLAEDVGNLAGGYAGGIAVPKVGKAFSGYAPRLYQSAMKPPPSIDPALRTKAIMTGLKEEIPVSESGLERLYGKNDVINQRIASIIDENPERVIQPQAVAARMRQIEPTFQQQVNPQEDLASLAKSKAQFLEKHTEHRPYTKIEFRPIDEGEVGAVPVGQATSDVIRPIPGPQAQAEKIGTYRQLRGKYGELKSADIEAQKALARGEKEELALQYPQIAPLNARESDLLSLQPMLERATGRIGNKDIGGISVPLTATAVKAATGSNPLSMVAGGAKSLFGLPAVKSNLAIELYRRGILPLGVQPRLGGLGGGALVAVSSKKRDENR